MMNHALFAGLLQAEATPVTDDPFHNRAFTLKLRRAAQDHVIQKIQADLARSRHLKADILAATALTDTQLNLPVLSPELPIDEMLEYRRKNDAALQQARDKLGWMARRIEAEPWSAEFVHEIEHRTIPDIAKDLDDARKALDDWIASARVRLALKAAGVVVGAATVALTVITAPLTPVALAIAGLGLASGSVIPGAEWLLDWRDGRNTSKESGCTTF